MNLESNTHSWDGESITVENYDLEVFCTRRLHQAQALRRVPEPGPASIKLQDDDESTLEVGKKQVEASCQQIIIMALGLF